MKSEFKQRGRPSAAAIALRQETLERTPRLPPPHDLTDEETEIWVGIINHEQADWFGPSTVPMLAQYCRHAVHARKIAEMLERLDTKKPEDFRTYSELLKLQVLQTNAMAHLATKMRISQQSINNQYGRKKITQLKRPWD